MASALVLQRLKNLNYPDANRLTKETLFAPGMIRYAVLTWLITSAFAKEEKAQNDDSFMSVNAALNKTSMALVYTQDDNLTYFNRPNLFNNMASMDLSLIHI